MQIVPLTTQLRDAWDDATEDGVIDSAEIIDLTQRIYQTDDSQHLGLRIMRVGNATRQSRAAMDEYQRLHGPIDFEARKDARIADHDPSAA